MSRTKDDGWMWILVNIPGLGGDCVFQIQSDSLETLGEKVRIRRFTQLKYGPNPKTKKLECRALPWMPLVFQVIDSETEVTMDRGVTPWAWWTEEVHKNLIKEVMAQWEPKAITPANEALMKAEMQRADRADKLRIPRTK